MTHRNARLTPVTRAELVEQVLSGWPQAEVARMFRVSRATVAKWVRRFREGGLDALHDRSSRPLRSPRQTDQLQEVAICAARRILAWGPHRIGWRLGIARSTVYAVLRRAGLHRLAWLHRTTREVVRYEHARPGDLVHLDIKKLGRIPQGGGKRILPGFGVGRASTAHHYVVQQAISHCPDNEIPFRRDAQLVLYAVEVVPDGHNAVTPCLGNLSVRLAAGKQRHRLQLQRRQLVHSLTWDGSASATDHRENLPHRLIKYSQPAFSHIQNGFYELLRW